MAKILVIGDPHFQEQNINDVEILTKGIYDLCEKTKFDFIVVLGDILHNHEKIHSLTMNVATNFIKKLREYARVYCLVGNHDYCFGKGTPILMADGSTKYIQDIQVNDYVFSDDYKTPSLVVSRTAGIGNLYKVKQSEGESYVVSENHVLCLVTRTNNLKIEMTVREYLELNEFKQYCLQGYTCTRKKSDIQIESLGKGEFYGITLDSTSATSSPLMLLNDFTVVHNCNNQQFLSDNHWMNALKEWSNVVIVDRVVSETIKGSKFTFCPYVPNGRLREALNTNPGWESSNLIFAHQEFQGCKMGAITSVDGDSWPASLPFVISGHIHDTQNLENVYYVGSALQNGYGAKDPILAVLDIDSLSKKPKITEVRLELPTKKIVYSDVSDLENLEITENKNSKVKITLSGNYTEFKALKNSTKYKEMIKKGHKITFKPKKLEKKEDEIVEPTETNFEKILDTLVSEEANPYLDQVHQAIFYNKIISPSDVIYLS